jgi:hypothetical protein
MRALGFCVNADRAGFMADQFKEDARYQHNLSDYSGELHRSDGQRRLGVSG